MAKKLKDYHYIWLKSHPDRNEEWLRTKIAEGFQVHHINGNHYDNDSSNLVLIEGTDHLYIHNKSTKPLRFLNKCNLIDVRVRKKLWITPCKTFFIKLKPGEKKRNISFLFEKNPSSYAHRVQSVGNLNDNEKIYYNITC